MVHVNKIISIKNNTDEAKYISSKDPYSIFGAKEWLGLDAWGRVNSKKSPTPRESYPDYNINNVTERLKISASQLFGTCLDNKKIVFNYSSKKW